MTTSELLLRTDRIPALLSLDENTEDHAVGRCANVTLYVWRRQTRPSLVTAVQRALARSEVAGTGLAAICGYIEPETTLPDADNRARLAEAMRGRGKALVASAMVFEGGGFRAAAARSVATGLAMLSRHSFPHRVFSTTKEAVVWLLGELDRRGAATPDPLALTEALGALRRAPVTG